ncbi:MAG: hypothetical protein K0S68_62 [Candidatus Saccharibacteria bacterium]|nr:hypothetical protein [Candidatus Saccharibacteria bacterium]
MAKKKKSLFEKGAVALSTPVDPSSTRAVFVVIGVVISGLIVISVAFAYSRG